MNALFDLTSHDLQLSSKPQLRRVISSLNKSGDRHILEAVKVSKPEEFDSVIHVKSFFSLALIIACTLHKNTNHDSSTAFADYRQKNMLAWKCRRTA